MFSNETYIYIFTAILNQSIKFKEFSTFIALLNMQLHPNFSNFVEIGSNVMSSDNDKPHIFQITP